MRSALVISGSPSLTSRTAALGDHVLGALAARGLSARHIRVRELPAEPLIAADRSSPPVAEALGLLREAEGVVFVTPTYQAAYSGLLKLFLDLLPQTALAEKAVLPLATGGTLAHVLMLDYALRPVLHALGARHSVQACFVTESAIDVSSPGFVTDVRQAELLEQGLDAFCAAIASVSPAPGPRDGVGEAARPRVAVDRPGRETALALGGGERDA
ncbi:FMN reductase (NADPH) [Hansschlegelia quercus]|uniref:FMN reductase (NADPH) n=1 Tax=Hansschlegelia quercus TaxID=2528245 RepID=A0A4Q9GJ39_9HYPH|nr:FMN reductase (NADPH) [Hansschlegelia quercus]